MNELFRNPAWIWWSLPILAALAGLGAWSESLRRSLLARLGNPLLFETLLPEGIQDRRRIRFFLRLAALFFLFTALAGPRWGLEIVPSEQFGVHVVLAVDTSSSMATEDIKPSRIEKAKLSLASLIDSLQGNRFGIVAFSGTAAIQCPLTTDAAAARLFLSALKTDILPAAGTSLGDAVRLAIRMLAPYPGQKGLVLLTDGEDTARSDPIGAASDARAAGVKIFAVGIGNPDGEPIPLRDASGKVTGYKRNEKGETVMSRLDEKTLAEMARTTGGTYHRSSAAESELNDITEQLEALDKNRLAQGMRERYKDRTQAPLVLALILLLAELLVPRVKETKAQEPPKAGNNPETSGDRAGIPVSRRGKAAAVRGVATGILFAGMTFFACGVFAKDLQGAAETVPAAHASPLLSWFRQLFGGGVIGNLWKGNRYLRQERHDQALESYRQAMASDPADPRPVYNEGIALYRMDDFSRAADSFQKSAEDASETGRNGLVRDSLYNRGNALFREGRIGDAVASYRQALTLHPEDSDTRHNLQIALKRLKEQKSQDKQDQKQQKKQPQQDQKKEQEKKKPPQGGLSPEDARRILETLREKEKTNFNPDQYNRAGKLSKPDKGGIKDDW